MKKLHLFAPQLEFLKLSSLLETMMMDSEDMSANADVVETGSFHLSFQTKDLKMAGVDLLKLQIIVVWEFIMKTKKIVSIFLIVFSFAVQACGSSSCLMQAVAGGSVACK